MKEPEAVKTLSAAELKLAGKPFVRGADELKTQLEKQLGFGFAGSITPDHYFQKGRKFDWATGTGPIVVIEGNSGGLKFVDVHFDGNENSNELAAVLQLLADSLCDEASLTSKYHKATADDIKNERTEVIAWISGPAIKCLGTAAVATDSPEDGEPLKTSVRAVFDSVTLRGQIIPRNGHAPGYRLQISPGRIANGTFGYLDE